MTAAASQGGLGSVFQGWPKAKGIARAAGAPSVGISKLGAMTEAPEICRAWCGVVALMETTMTVPHLIVCHIKMAISDRTRPDMGWRRAPLASAHAALRQGKEKEAWLKGPAGSRTGSGPPLLFL